MDWVSGVLGAFSPIVLLWNGLGVLAGIMVGSIPGLTATMAVALLIPFSFGMEPMESLALLLGIYVGTMYGVGIPACLLNIPGNPSGIMTVRDGYPMAMKGEGGKAIGAVAVASFVGGLAGIVALVALAEPISRIALRFGPAEMFAVAVWGLASVSDLTGDTLVLGVISALAGLWLGTIGIDPVTGVARFTFNSLHLQTGVDIIPVLIGLFGMAEILRQVNKNRHQSSVAPVLKAVGIAWADVKRMMKPILRGSLIGLWVGILPGSTGGSMASILSYEFQKRSSKTPEEYGTGMIEGVAAPEAANNAMIGGNLVPLLTLGIPGDAVTAVLIGAFMIHGLQPGPLLFQKSPNLVYGIYADLFIAQFFMLFLGVFGARFFAKVTSVPMKTLLPLTAVLCVTGAYAANMAMADVIVMMLFAAVGYLMSVINMPLAPMILGIVLGPIAEYNLRTALLLFDGNWVVAFTRPLVLVMWALTAVILVLPRLNLEERLLRRMNRSAV